MPGTSRCFPRGYVRSLTSTHGSENCRIASRLHQLAWHVEHKSERGRMGSRAVSAARLPMDVSEGVANLQYDRKVKPSSQKQIFRFLDILGSSLKIMRSALPRGAYRRSEAYRQQDIPLAQ